MKRSWLCFLLPLCLVLVASPAIAAVVKLAYGGPGASNQLAIKGIETIIKGGLVDADPAAMSFRWTIDTKPATVIVGNITAETNLRDLSARFVFSGNQNVKLEVFDGADATGNLLGSDSTKVVPKAVNDTQKIEMVIDDALWYLHTQLIPEGDSVTWRDRNYNEGLIMIASAFIKAGYSLSGLDPATVPVNDDPYVEDVWRLVNHVLGNLYSGTEGTYYCTNDEITYGFGPALEVVARSGYPSTQAIAGVGTVGELVQNMVNWLAWFQLGDNGYDWNGCTITLADPPKAPCPTKDELATPATSGGWPYLQEGWGCSETDDLVNYPTGFAFDWNKGTYGDTSISWWAVTGLKAAEAFGAAIPASVKPNLAAFLNNSNPCAPDNFGPTTSWNLIERAGQGITLFDWVGDPAGVAACSAVINSWFPFHNYQHGQSHPWAEAGTQECVDWSLDGVAPCYSHFKLDAWEICEWQYVDGQWNCLLLGTTHDINLFAFKTVAEGAKLSSGAVTPCATYIPLLWDNQQFFGNGSIDDLGWGDGYLFGTAWAVDTMIACRP